MTKEQFPVTRSDEEWRRVLTAEQYAVLPPRHRYPGSCALLSEHRAGTFSAEGATDRYLLPNGSSRAAPDNQAFLRPSRARSVRPWIAPTG